MTAAVRALNETEATLKEADVDGNVGYAPVTSPSYGGGSLTWVSGSGTAALTGMAFTAWGGAALDGFEVHAVMSAPTGSTAKGGPGVRIATTSGSAKRGYFARETTAGDATSWQVVKWDGTTATTLGTLTPSGVSGYGCNVKLIAFGTQIKLKVWSGSEPDWGTVANVLTVTDSTYTTGDVGMAAWGLTASGHKVVWTSCATRPVGTVMLTQTFNLNDTAANTNSYSQTATIYADTPYWLFVSNQVGSGTANTPSITAPSGVTVSSALHSATFAGTNTRRFSAFVLQSNADVTGQVTASFSSQNQSGCSMHLVRCWGADPTNANGTAGFGTVDTKNPNTTSTSIVSALTFSSPQRGVSGTIQSAAHDKNETTAGSSPLSTIAAGNYSTPTAAAATSGTLTNVTGPTTAWTTTTANRTAVAAEVIVSPWYTEQYRTVTGAAALTGTGSQTAAGVRKRIGAATLSGTGSLTAAGTVTPGSTTVTGAADLTGTGTLSASGTRTRSGAATLTGTGTQTASGTRTTIGAATLTGTGTLSASGTRTRSGAAALTGTGTLSASASAVVIVGAATLTGTGTSTSAGTRTTNGAATLTGAGTSTSAGTVVIVGAATLTGTGTSTTAGTRTTIGAADLTGTGTSTTSGTRTTFGSATLAGTGILSAASSTVTFGAADLTGTGTLIGALATPNPLLGVVAHTAVGLLDHTTVGVSDQFTVTIDDQPTVAVADGRTFAYAE